MSEFLSKSKFSNRLISKFTSIVHDTEDCIMWPFSKFENGYGQQVINFEGKELHSSSHRVSYAIFNGDIPDNLRVCHSCDTPSCINPKHLFLGTDKDNHDDCFNKGRLGSNPSNGHLALLKKSKLSDADIEEIRRLYVKGKKGFGYVSLAKRFGIGAPSCKRIISNKIRKNV